MVDREPTPSRHLGTVKRPDPRGLPPYRGATTRYWLTLLVVRLLPRLYVRLRVEGLEQRPTGGAVYCFNHLSWVDPIVLLAALPASPRVYFFGPKEEDMMVGGRNRLMRWAGISVPYRPGGRGLIEATRRVEAVLGVRLDPGGGGGGPDPRRRAAGAAR